MTISNQQIDQIVATVVDRLRALSHQNVLTASHNNPLSQQTAKPPQQPMSVSVESKVVSVIELEKLSGQFKTVVVSDRSIVTPAARDWLKERSIKVHRTNQPGNKGATLTPQMAIIANSAKCSVAENLADTFAASVEYIPQLQSIAPKVNNHLSAGKRVLVISTSHHALAMRLNRNHNVRAFAPITIEHLTQALTQDCFNVLVVNAFDNDAQQVEAIARNWLQSNSNGTGVTS